MSSIVAAIIVALVVAQGGYFPLAACAAGVVASAVGLGVQVRYISMERLSSVTMLLSALAVASFISAIGNRATLTVLSGAGTWAAVATMSSLAFGLSEEARERALRLISWSGVVLAVFGILTSAGVISFVGSLEGNRLDFTFQYANATGVWFGCCVLLCLVSGDERLYGLSVFPALCLLLTESGGAITAFAVVSTVLGMRWLKGERWADLFRALSTGVIAVCAFGLSRWISPLFGLAVVLAWAFISRYLEHRRFTDSRERILCLVLMVALAGSALISGLALHTRAISAAGNLMERFYHVKDAVALWSTSPLLGVGPNMWQYLYSHYQSAQYVTKLVHCSYAQTLVDSGLLGFCLLIAACVTGMCDLVKRAGTMGGLAEGEAAAAALILLHSVVDFDLRFGAIAFLLAFLLTVPEGKQLAIGKGVTLWCCIIPCLALCLVGGFSDMSLAAMQTENLAGDWAGCVSLYRRNPLAKDDPGATAACLEALVQLGESETAADLVSTVERPTDEEALLGALSLYRLGRHHEAGELLVSQMEMQPYNYQLFINAKALVDAYGLDASLVPRYNAAVDLANELVDAANPLLPRQRRIDTYLEVPTGMDVG